VTVGVKTAEADDFAGLCGRTLINMNDQFVIEACIEELGVLAEVTHE
jgi:hypothetical protein